MFRQLTKQCCCGESGQVFSLEYYSLIRTKS